MKTYKFTLNNVNDNNNYYNDYYNSNTTIDDLKNKIANKLADKYSWFAKPIHTSSSFSTPVYTTTYSSSKLNFDKDYYTMFDVINNYGKRYSNNNIDDYDFTIDGTPVRIMGDMIQIGYHMFSTNAASNYYINLAPAAKKIVLDIVIKIKSYNF